MKKSSLFRLLITFSGTEIREVERFLCSPFFNTRDDLIRLFDYLAGQEAPDKREAWRAVYGAERVYDDQKCRLLMSYLHRLLEHFIAIKELSRDELNLQLHLAKGYRRRRMSGAFDRTHKALKKQMQSQLRQDARMLELDYLLQIEQNRFTEATDPADSSHLQLSAGKLDLYYLAARLRIICLSLSQRTVYQAESRQEQDADIISMAQRHPDRDLPSVRIYLLCYHMLTHPMDESSFLTFKSYLLASTGRFSDDEMRGLYLMAVNYCIRRLNNGEENYFQEVLDLYKPSLQSGYLLENGVLSRFTYHNIVAAGLRTGELDWVKQFIHSHKNALERKYRESSFSFNLARLEYTRNNFDAVLELLQKANYRDPLLNLAAKTLLLKTYYQLDEYDLLHSHLDAMRNYVRRKRVLGYHRTNYLNIVRYADKLLSIHFGSEKEVQKLVNEIAQEEVLTEKEWFLGQLLPG